MFPARVEAVAIAADGRLVVGLDREMAMFVCPLLVRSRLSTRSACRAEANLGQPTGASAFPPAAVRAIVPTVSRHARHIVLRTVMMVSARSKNALMAVSQRS